ncbi:hypothetical protein TIFTF001_022462 [Ficus carica]|uniref:Uncharacterized protein n=1 Tax=Ficus carica TaxID=3494 RepID=A0AA88AHU5_FICCA|nr:hypothetical protein TIFTF001_022462 [Ficus carica]
MGKFDFEVVATGIGDGPVIATEDGFRGGHHDHGTLQSRLSPTSRGCDFWWWTELRRLQLRRQWARRRLLRGFGFDFEGVSAATGDQGERRKSRGSFGIFAC